MPIIDDIYQVFIDYFGEDKVDKQLRAAHHINLEYFDSPSTGEHIILVHWPTVTVTNEYDGHIDIWDLYAATVVNSLGRLVRSPRFIRSTYDRIQWHDEYMHSHIPHIDKNNLTQFRSSCLGTGPIGSTISRLSISEECRDLNVWRLYCWELDKYVSVESLAGGPYMRLQYVGSNTENNISENNCFYLQPYRSISMPAYVNCLNLLLDKILKEKILKFSFSNGTYSIASPYIDTVLQISNAFIDMYNNDSSLRERIPKENLYRNKFIQKMRIYNGKICPVEDSGNIPIEAVVGTPLFIFKGKEVTLQLKDFNQNYESSDLLLVGLPIINYIITSILKYVNFYYGKATNTINEEVRVI